ncbi:MAG: aspartate ammonia-lyase [Gammaproteobacteria bacterium 28-57-27]|nr:MAG: aspartate ammonia-lyase [Gammaproteobacteria bacterium 28-57-27]
MTIRDTENFRVERDSMGELHVPVGALWGAQTQRAVENFGIGARPMPRAFIRALGLVKAACAKVNHELGLLDVGRADLIVRYALEVAEGGFDQHFPVDVFQTGSGTSSNMNANEVVARLAGAYGTDIHANDHVNMGQSSNDVIPTAIHLSASLEIIERLLPSTRYLRESIDRRAEEWCEIVKTGRTHLMDAMPITLGQELSAWSAQLQLAEQRLRDSLVRLQRLPQGGTAVGTGINAPENFAALVSEKLSELTGVPFTPMDNLFMGLASQDTSVEVAGQVRALAVALMKISNDLRWMNSGPLAGLGEIALPALQPGSSIMPGKVNPVIPEAVTMACARVMGHDTAIAIAGQSGNFQLNVMLPLIADSLLDSISLMSNACMSLADQVINGMQVNMTTLSTALHRNPILVTALNPVLGYEKGAALAKRAYAEGRTLLEVALEDTDLDEKTLRILLDPSALARGGLQPGMKSSGG